MMLRYVDDSFTDTYTWTIGEFREKILDIDNQKIKIEIWDTNNRFNTNYRYYRGAEGIMIFFDITDKSTYESIHLWIMEINEYAKQALVIVLVGTKCDLEEQRAVSIDEIEMIARDIGIHYIETSSKNKVNVENCFEYIANEIYNQSMFSLQKKKNHPILELRLSKKKEKK
eukprot:TRINITY_DN3000_c0_g1_i3.p1 TRINITY_DN3000_c0_g1~~TRINITY_DN3000_c0_g1_i3.p1  ORF type:complete len:171 (+),score=32.36 TRINITY_DN3000_c0_g1_i3:98-610(+)